MNLPERYENDVLFFFEGKPETLALYQELFRRLDRAFPEASVKVQKSQISFYGTHLFAMASLPKRKKDQGLVVTFGLGRREPSPRVGVAVEPCPGRWTHHVAVTRDGEIDAQLLDWLSEAWDFSRAKGRRGSP